MSLLLRRLLSRFLVLPVEPNTPPAEEASGGADAAPPAEDTLDDLIDAAGDLEPEVPRETQPDGTTAAPRREPDNARLERELREERIRRETLEQQFARGAPAAAPSRDPEFDAEERRLEEARKSGMDANSIGWMKWQIDTNRANRQTQREARDTLREARDVTDRGAFAQLQTTNPGLYKRYADKVETEVSRLRSQGVQIPPRTDILKYLAGNDLVSGNLKRSTPKPTATPAPTVDRGRMPQTRTDVRGRANAASERDKRRERLRDVPL